MDAIFRIIDKKDVSGRIRYSSLGSLYGTIDRLVGGKLHTNGIPVAMEVEGWAELAEYDEVWENKDIVVICEEA